MANQPLQTKPAPDLPEPKQWPMVGWYDPRQLAKTGVEVAISTIFGRHSDQRLVEAMASGDRKEPPFYDYTHLYTDNGAEICKPDETRPRASIWIDYVGDVGDGWNSTYAVAYNLTQDLGFDKTETKRGDVLIFGGDEVYPTASRDVYNERLLTPYQTATRARGEWNDPGPFAHVFAIPGNHDWYDSLVAFTRLFTSNRWFGRWRTRQSRSYFALKLPHNWWLLGTDVQLGSDIDRPQVQYFERLRQHMDEEEAKTKEPATIILCHAEPHWIRAWQYEGIDPNYSESNLRHLEKTLGKKIAVYIAGDLHHYRRHEARDQSTQKITAGGGGAFLHPTHPGFRGKKFDVIFEREKGEEKFTLDDVEKKRIPDDRVFDLKGCFPSTRDSFWATFGNLKFPFFWPMGNKSWSLGLVTGALYLLLTLPIVFRINDAGFLARSYSPGNVIGILIQTMFANPVVALLILLTLVGFLFFTDTHKRLHRFFGGGLHGLAHIFAAYSVAFLSVSLLGNNLPRATWRTRFPWPTGFEFFMDWRKLIALIAIFVGGFILGTFIMGLYVLISLNLFGRHGNEAFSSLAIEDWKNFLRMQIDTNGNLAIYPIGIRRVPRKWKRSDTNTGPEYVPDDPKATRPTLIEKPIFIMKDRDTDTGTRKKPTPTGQ